jgi:hypothetical protein
MMASTGEEWEILPRYSFKDVQGGISASWIQPGIDQVGSATLESLGDAEADDKVARLMSERWLQRKPCPACGRDIHHVRTLTGPVIRNGRHEVWVHTDTGYAPCNVDANGLEVMPAQQVYVLFQEVSDQYGTSKPIGVFMHDLTEAEQQALSPTKLTYVKKFEVQP